LVKIAGVLLKILSKRIMLVKVDRFH